MLLLVRDLWMKGRVTDERRRNEWEASPGGSSGCEGVCGLSLGISLLSSSPLMERDKDVIVVKSL